MRGLWFSPDLKNGVDEHLDRNQIHELSFLISVKFTFNVELDNELIDYLGEDLAYDNSDIDLLVNFYSSIKEISNKMSKFGYKINIKQGSFANKPSVLFKLTFFKELYE